ncbi:hypothetical protein F2Q69_00052058 [Brassica cretica]|uniref:Uncharacterized protein n=1 Tax=Brassica cretica TaxID=69181 RepID=A0A8S9MV18_BRACR|nr:hypothetical protein F2Q69_00052058 [Brassica cretica]
MFLDAGAVGVGLCRRRLSVPPHPWSSSLLFFLLVSSISLVHLSLCRCQTRLLLTQLSGRNITSPKSYSSSFSCSPSKVVPSTTLLEVPLRQPPILLLKRHRNSTSLDACRSDPRFQWLIRSSHPLYATAIFIPYLSVHYAVCALHLSFVLVGSGSKDRNFNKDATVLGATEMKGSALASPKAGRTQTPLCRQELEVQITASKYAILSLEDKEEGEIQYEETINVEEDNIEEDNVSDIREEDLLEDEILVQKEKSAGQKGVKKVQKARAYDVNPKSKTSSRRKL